MVSDPTTMVEVAPPVEQAASAPAKTDGASVALASKQSPSDDKEKQETVKVVTQRVKSGRLLINEAKDDW